MTTTDPAADHEPSTDPLAGIPTMPPQMPAGPRRRLFPALRPLLSLLPFAAAAAFVLRFDPTDRTGDPTGPCLWHTATGINGPTCGGTRMFYYLIQGNVVEAARHHLPALLAVPFLVYAWLRWALNLWFGVRLPALKFGWKTYVAYGVFFVVFTTVLRNLSWGPFSWFNIPNLDMG